MDRTVEDSNLRGRNEKSLLPLVIRFGYPKELENVPYIFPACYSAGQKVSFQSSH